MQRRPLQFSTYHLVVDQQQPQIRFREFRQNHLAAVVSSESRMTDGRNYFRKPMMCSSLNLLFLISVVLHLLTDFTA